MKFCNNPLVGSQVTVILLTQLLWFWEQWTQSGQKSQVTMLWGSHFGMTIEFYWSALTTLKKFLRNLYIAQLVRWKMEICERTVAYEEVEKCFFTKLMLLVPGRWWRWLKCRNPHSSFPPDLGSSDFYMLAELKKNSQERIFDTIKNWPTKQRPKKIVLQEMFKDRWHNIIALDGSHVKVEFCQNVAVLWVILRTFQQICYLLIMLKNIFFQLVCQLGFLDSHRLENCLLALQLLLGATGVDLETCVSRNRSRSTTCNLIWYKEKVWI